MYTSCEGEEFEFVFPFVAQATVLSCTTPTTFLVGIKDNTIMHHSCSGVVCGSSTSITLSNHPNTLVLLLKFSVHVSINIVRSRVDYT